MKQNKKAIGIACAILITHLAICAVTYFFFNNYFIYATILGFVLDIFGFITIIKIYDKSKWQLSDFVGKILSKSVKESLLLNKCGFIVYDEDLNITYATDLFDKQGLNVIGKKISKALPGCEQVLDGANKGVCRIGNKIYQVIKSSNNQVVYFSDVTDITTLGKKYREEMKVLGIINFDNYEETISFEDETKIAKINMAIIQTAIRYLEQYNGIVKRTRSGRYIVMMNQNDLEAMIEDKFSINETVKSIAEKMNVNITLSMAFGCGCNDFNKLDDACSDAMELVLGRGGDQVAVKDVEETIKFYGNSSESDRDNSKVKARMIALAMRDLIKESDNVVIVPHKYADYDAVGACIGIKKIVEAYGKKAYLLLKDIPIESHANNHYISHIQNTYNANAIINSKDALDLLQENTLVIVADHHSLDQCCSPEVVENSRCTIVIDHHRRKDEQRIKASLMYNDSTASSSVEMVTELMQYQAENIQLSDNEATYMYTGVLVDTDNLKKRCSARTFESCAYLKKAGADINEANDWLKDNILTFVKKTSFLGNCIAVNNEVVIATYPYKEEVVDRTLCAIVANELLTIKDVQASFAIAKTDEDVVSVSARSNGTINVQLILEELGGGGHFNMAACQFEGMSVEQVKEIVSNQIVNYLKGVNNDESNSIK